MAKHIFDPIRVTGTGRWLREENGAWSLKSFKVRGFDTLLKNDLREAIEELRAIDGSNWKAFDDPVAALKALRDRSGGLH